MDKNNKDSFLFKFDFNFDFLFNIIDYPLSQYRQQFLERVHVLAESELAQGSN